MQSQRAKRERHGPKVLVSKVGLDGHDRGAKVIARALMEAGFEVVYLGVHRTAQQVVRAALEEDASVLAVSILSGAHLELAKDLFAEMKRQGVRCSVVMGGIIPADEVQKLKKLGVFDVIGPGASLEDVVTTIRRASEVSD